MQLYRGWLQCTNIWLAWITPDYSNRDWEYAYYIQGGVHLTTTCGPNGWSPIP